MGARGQADGGSEMSVGGMLFMAASWVAIIALNVFWTVRLASTGSEAPGVGPSAPDEADKSEFGAT